jgi:hypothetical protein
MNKYELTATHQAFGEVRFILLSKSHKAAFAAFKNIVFNHKQWIVKDNALLAGIEKDAGDRGGPGRHLEDCGCIECDL